MSRRFSRSCGDRFARRQHGASLVVSLLMLVAVAILGLSAAQIALQEEKASRNEGERQIAMQAAEAALVDAEIDIENSSRSYLFVPDGVEGFAADCESGQSDLYLGLCRQSAPENPAVWQSTDLAGEQAMPRSVPYGHFTGRILQTGSGPLPARLPRYIIELLPYKSGNAAASGASPSYRITAIGFGTRTSTQVVRQSIYRKAGGRGNEAVLPSGRVSWREIPNWKELRNALAKK